MFVNIGLLLFIFSIVMLSNVKLVSWGLFLLLVDIFKMYVFCFFWLRIFFCFKISFVYKVLLLFINLISLNILLMFLDNIEYVCVEFELKFLFNVFICCFIELFFLYRLKLYILFVNFGMLLLVLVIFIKICKFLNGYNFFKEIL